DRLDIIDGAVLPKREPQRGHAELAGHTHRGEHVRRLDRARAAGGSRRAGDAGQIEMHQERLTVRARDRNVGDVWRALALPALARRVRPDPEATEAPPTAQ